MLRRPIAGARRDDEARAAFGTGNSFAFGAVLRQEWGERECEQRTQEYKRYVFNKLGHAVSVLFVWLQCAVPAVAGTASES